MRLPLRPRSVLALAAALCTLSAVVPAAHAADEHTVTYQITVGSNPVGTRTLTVRTEPRDDGPDGRFLEALTTISGSVGPVSLSWRQRLTGVATDVPASFHAVIDEGGAPREVQASWDPRGWTVTTADTRRSRTDTIDAHRLDLSTVDLMDPGASVSLLRLDEVRILSAETGDIWASEVVRLGHDRIDIAGTPVDVHGVAWSSPQGRSELWYDADGWLVRYTMRVLGYKVQGTLTAPPPRGPDDFAVRLGRTQVDVEAL